MKIHEPTYWPVVEGVQAVEKIRVDRLSVLKAMDIGIVLDMDIEAMDDVVAIGMAIVLSEVLDMLLVFVKSEERDRGKYEMPCLP